MMKFTPAVPSWGQQSVHVVLIGLCVIRVADIAAHGKAQKFAAEVIFETGADNFLAVEEVLGSDKPHDRIDQHRVEVTGKGVGTASRRSADPSRDARQRKARSPGRFRNT